MKIFFRDNYKWQIILAGFIFICCAQVVAQESSTGNEEYETETLWHKSAALFPIRIITPDNFNPEKVYPAVLALHGFAGSSEKFAKISRIFAEAGFITIVPEGPYSVTYYDTLKRSTWEMSIWTTPKMTDDLELQMKTAELTIFEYLPGAIKRVEENYSISSLYAFGFSLGGVYSLLTGFYHRDKIEGVIAFGAEFDENWFTLTGDKLEDGNHVPIYYVLGADDHWITVEKAEKNRDLLKEAGYDVTLDIFEGGHFVDEEALKRSVNWLKNIN